MRHKTCDIALTLTAVLLSCTAVRGQSVDDLISQAKDALRAEHGDEAVRLLDRALTSAPKNATVYSLRAAAYGLLDSHVQAVADWDRVLALDPNNAEAFDRRGSEEFKLGHFAKAIADFDKFLKLHPEEEAGHWRRGIAYYYAGRYEDGKKQFEHYQQVDGNDVENAVWRYLCMAKSVGPAKARTAMLKIGNDRRVPMMQVYEVFCGRAAPETILAAVSESRGAEKQMMQQRFLAHLYLGLYYDVQNEKSKALEYMTKAAELHDAGGYMGDVARVQQTLLKRER